MKNKVAWKCEGCYDMNCVIIHSHNDGEKCHDKPREICLFAKKKDLGLWKPHWVRL